MQILTIGIVLGLILMVAALSGMFSEKAGIVNIAINGMMIGGALIFWLVQQKMNIESTGMQIVGYLIAMTGGLVIGAIFGFATITLKANQVIAGTAMNLLFAAIGLFLYKYMGAQKVALIDGKSGALSEVPTDFKYIFGIVMLISLVVFIISYVWIKFTPWGLRLSAAGENPQALDSQGISVKKTRYYGVLISGVLASLAGAMYIKTVGIFHGNVAGLGFVSLAILIAGQWNPIYIFISAFSFGLLYSTGLKITAYDKSLSSVQSLIQMLPFVLSLSALIITSKRSRSPKAAGVPYDKSKR